MGGSARLASHGASGIRRYVRAVCLLLAGSCRLLAQNITEFPVPTLNGFPLGITAGPDGALWFTEQPNGIGRIDVPKRRG